MGISDQRRTFAIISHPDAGKTTLTEKLLLGSGAIHIAGEVKARGARRHAHSDWMEMERKRGISVTSSVMTFEHRGVTFNLLDTPGHQDFSEDTYRTLTAVDSAIMVLDAAKGIETQTRKLFEVCRMRDIPIITFINQMDRETRDPFELLEEIEKTLALDVSPVTWPVGMGGQFAGCYHLHDKRFAPYKHNADALPVIAVSGPDDAALEGVLSEEQRLQLIEDTGLLDAAGKPFDMQSYREGHLTPVYFGTALKDFGVGDLLDGLLRFAPPPGAQKADTREVSPDEPKVTGFVFKIQANMDPNHRDRVAFVRLCSGVFKRGMKLKDTRSGKVLAVQTPVFFLARERALTEEAHPGDIIGIPNHGVLRIGDTLTEGEALHFRGIPTFAPEILRRVRLGDPMRVKHLRKALEDLSQEGVSQLFKPLIGSEWLVGVVGRLQLDVLVARIESEYGIHAGFEDAPFETARWVFADDKAELERFIDRNRSQMALDGDDRPVYLARTEWDLKTIQNHWDKIRFHKTREQFG
ncbi:MAG: peptide chain release factor 3 [Alphaproteobacteria bacterium]|nr:peptide chain release factor 3 [Alphaproteobacteria bacterium]